jgi:4'-phosphopantetheinyl transferase EntD
MWLGDEPHRRLSQNQGTHRRDEMRDCSMTRAGIALAKALLARRDAAKVPGDQGRDRCSMSGSVSRQGTVMCAAALERPNGATLDVEQAVQEVATYLRGQLEPEATKQKLLRVLSGDAVKEDVDEFCEGFARNLVGAWEVIARVREETLRRTLHEIVRRAF